ncbi:MAG: hypothetical protein J5711_05150 [Bacteroidales bacterium]|nr:hypothetical protein [Bacteroidales bacterium]
MKSTYKVFRESVKRITHYYMLLVDETKSQRTVGSTNEWVLDNYYIISEQEKMMREELKGLEHGAWKIERKRLKLIGDLLRGYLERCHWQVDKGLMFRYLTQVQVGQKDFLNYREVYGLLPLVKMELIRELGALCAALEKEGAHHYKVTEKPDMERLDRAAKENLKMMNIFNSLKKMTKLPLAELVERVSFSEKMLGAEKVDMYAQMYDRTKEDYRAKIVRNCKKEGVKEYDYVRGLVARADEKGVHVGWELFPPKKWDARSKAYVWIVALCTLGIAFGLAWLFMPVWWQALLFAIVFAVPASQVVIDLFNRVLYRLHKPKGTFRLKFKDGIIPQEYATMVIMPTILKNKAKTIQLLEQLEVYYLSNINRGEGHINFEFGNSNFENGDGTLTKKSAFQEQNLYYTLIGDAAAYGEESAPWDDEVVEAGMEKVKELNEKYGAPIFNFVYRRRAWSEGEGCWLGHERKRGAILHFNDLLLGETSEEEKQKRFRCETVSEWLRTRTGETEAVGSSQSADRNCPIQFIITLDTDTELVLYSAQKLVGAMAHPLNRAKLSGDGRRVDSGYGIMQPRVNVDVEVTNKSRYAQLFAGLGGLDVYTTASFELYQDIFNEGSFCGKGIYDLRVFQQVLKGTFPENLILSHDLIEGCHIRCGLINDVELFDDNPSNYIDDAKRHHRWTRGDWQVMGWLKNQVRNEKGEKVKNQVNTIGRWKIFDNLRRSVLNSALLVMIMVGFVLTVISTDTSLHLPSYAIWHTAAFALTTIALIVAAFPILFFLLGQISKLPHIGKRYKYYMTLMRGMWVVVCRSVVQFALMPKEAWMYTDAIIRSCYRMQFSHRNLLNWVPSDEASKSTKGTLGDYVAKFWFNYVCAAVTAVITFFCIMLSQEFPWLTVIACVFCVLSWCGAPFLMYSLGKKLPDGKRNLNAVETEEVKQLAHDTWHFFDSMLTEENNWLIPDNYQLNREKKTDYKTSPTNIGYSLTSVISAAELGFIKKKEAVTRLEHIIDTVVKLEKWNGHLFNWYDIHTLRALPHFFISTCDSGNFVACLYVVKGFLSSQQSENGGQQVEALLAKVCRLIDNCDFTKLYNHELDVFSIGYDYGSHTLLPYHYNNFASEARLTSFLTIAQGDAPYKHWFCLDKTLVQYKGYKGVASWYGTLFEYFMPLIFLPTYRHTLMDETYSFAIRAQKAFVRNTEGSRRLPWGISETAYNELDDAQNYKYHAFGVPYLKFQNTTPDRIVISPYSSLMTIGLDDKAVYENMQLLKGLKMMSGNSEDGSYGFYESYDEEDHVPVLAHYAHHQGMILASLANYLGDHCLQNYFMQEPAMRSMETLLKEKAQVKPYIDLKVTQYKRYQYSKTQTESDARDYDTIATVPEIGVISNGQYTVLMNDRGSGFSRYKGVMINRYRKISSDHHGVYLFVRNLRTDHLWSATYAPLDVMPKSYHVNFASDKISFSRIDDDVETKTEVTVLKDRSAEIRRYTFTNNGNRDIDLEITSYGEVVLAAAAEDESHRVFNGMKIHSEYDSDHEALLFNRPAANGNRNYVLHKLWVEEDPDETAPILNYQLAEYETSRLKFLGRGGSLQHADIIESHRTLTGTVGTTLDPVMSMRRRLHIPAGKKVEAYLIIAFAKAREQLLQLTKRYQTPVDVEHAFKTASVFNNMRTDLSLLKGAQMRLYNSISKYMAQTATLGNDRQAVLAKNTLSQSGLWRFGISGDLAILLLEVDRLEKSGFAKEMLRAFEYFKIHGLRLDLVIVNDAKGADRDSLTHFVRNMSNTEHLWSTHSDAGHVYVLNGDDLSEAERILLHTVARLSFNTRDGLTIEQQLRKLEEANQHYQDKVEYPVMKSDKQFRVWSSLDYYNQYGGFDNEGRDYVVTNTNTPMPWVNVISNGKFGCVVSSTMSGFTFAYNAQQFKLTSWSNDMVRDQASEMLLINKCQFVPATARHSQGYSAFDAEYADFKVSVRVFVPIDKMEKYYQIKIENKSDQKQAVRLDMVYKLVMGMCEEQTARFLHSEWDEASQSIRVRNVYHPIYRNQMLAISAIGTQSSETTYSLDAPNRKSIGLKFDIEPHGTNEVAFVLSVSPSDAMQTVTHSIADINGEFTQVQNFWDEKLGYIQVDTPDRSFNYMLNRWYLYQVYSSRLYARAGFYQVGGATGFRDQLQDVMSLLYSDPEYARRQILDHAAHQFAEGDVLHWWHESMHLGARTTFSDDYLWLVFVTHQYVKVTGDTSILNEQVPFCQADQLAPGENERGMNYISGVQPSDGVQLESATLYEHLRRSVNRSMSRIGVHGLPLMGCGDWNDGMSTVGSQGKGESVWVAFFLADLLPKMEELTQMMPSADLSYCGELSQFRTRIVDAIQSAAWDGAWFLRAYYDNGDPMGSRNNTECQIDLISQAWSILTDVATPEQKESVMRETDNRLVNREHEIIQLLTPAFHQSQPSPGYIMNYPEGVRENGGQYTHGAMWYIMAQLKEGRYDMAYFLYSLINPIHRTQTLADVLKYKVEPYCMAADIYSNPQHPGRGGWTWYTGSASWAYKTGIENILGLRKCGNQLTIAPCVPSEWDSFTVRYRYGSAVYLIRYERHSSAMPIPTTIDLVDDGKEHQVTVN